MPPSTMPVTAARKVSCGRSPLKTFWRHQASFCSSVHVRTCSGVSSGSATDYRPREERVTIRVNIYHRAGVTAGRRRCYPRAGMGSKGWMVGLFVALALAPRATRAEKKKPGLFDFQTWKSPVAKQREAAQELAPGQIDVTPLGERRAEPLALRLRVYAD